MAESAPTSRRSSSGQDPRHSSLERGVQLPPRRSEVKQIHVTQVPARALSEVMETEHYLHSMPKAASLTFGVYRDERLLGGVVFAAGARQQYRVVDAGRPKDTLTLARLWLSDDLPKNSESRVLGVVLRELRRRGTARCVATFADPAAGHSGTIYRASGFRYLGQAPPSNYLDLGDGKLVHPRSVYSRLGSNSVGHLRRTGVGARRVRVPGKHRFLYVVDPAWGWRVRDGVSHPAELGGGPAA